MNQTLRVHYAVACLEGLDAPVTPQDLSRAQQVPLRECVRILKLLESAGLVREDSGGRYARLCAMENLTALEILQALWASPKDVQVQLLYASLGGCVDGTTRFWRHPYATGHKAKRRTGTHVSRNMKRVFIIGWLLLGLHAVAQQVEAAQPDTITLSVTPSGIIYSVQISSVPNTGYNFGTVTIGGTTVSTAAITVSNTGEGNTAEYFGMKVSNTNDGWQPGVPGADTFRLIGQFQTDQPHQATGFNTGNAITGSFPSDAAGLYGQTGKTGVGSNQKLWLRLEMPTAVNTWSGGSESMTLYIQGQSS